MSEFRTAIGKTVFEQKYAHKGCETWAKLSKVVAEDVCGGILPPSEVADIAKAIKEFKFIPGGRYLYYAGRPEKAYFNCYLSIPQEDSRGEWARLVKWATSSLMQGGGIGTDYSVFRPKGAPIRRTGGESSGPLALMQMVNEVGRFVMQGGSRRSAIFASLNWQHADAEEFLSIKDWSPLVVAEKLKDFNFPAPLDHTNISLGYDDNFLALVRRGKMPETFRNNVVKAMSTGEPGFAFNFGPNAKETARNACTEVTSSSPYDACNLGSVNMAACTKEEFATVCELGSRFLYCGTIRGKIDHQLTEKYQDDNRRLGLGLMGMHEWLLQRNSSYEMTDELRSWMEVYERKSKDGVNTLASILGLPSPLAYRAIAPTGSIGMIAGTTTGIEPLYAVAYKRRYLKGTEWHYQYVVDGTARSLIEKYGLNPDKIDTAAGLATDYRKRIEFQADVQDYVDMAISSTINLPEWGSEHNNEDKVDEMANTLAEFAPRLRGFTCYPDGARGGQPLTAVPYDDALKQEGVEFKEFDVCEIGKGGTCGS